MKDGSPSVHARYHDRDCLAIRRQYFIDRCAARHTFPRPPSLGAPGEPMGFPGVFFELQSMQDTWSHFLSAPDMDFAAVSPPEMHFWFLSGVGPKRSPP